MPEAYELWALTEDGVREVHLYSGFILLSDFREDTFHTHFFNARRFQIPFLVCRAVNKSVGFLNVVRTTQHVLSHVTSWNPNLFLHSWGVNPTDMIPPNVSTITRHAYDHIRNFHGVVFRSNHDCLRLKRIELKRISFEELLARIRQYIRDDISANVCSPVNHALGDASSNDYDSNDGWLDTYNSN